MAQEKTPGVYIKEKPAFPNSVVEVATSIPAFLGYTEKAVNGTAKIGGVPTRITSMAEFESHFGFGPQRVFTRTIADNGSETFTPKSQDLYLYNTLKLYFNNGGGPCWIVSVGTFAADQHSVGDFKDAIWADLAKVQEPSMYVIPDAVVLTRADYKALSETAMNQCVKLKDRVALLDVYDGANSEIGEVIDGPTGFRNLLQFPDEPSYGVAYYPWLNTSIIALADITFTSLDGDSLSQLADDVKAALPPETPEASLALVDKLKSAPASDADAIKTHNALMSISPLYAGAMEGLLKAMNVLPPAAAMAGSLRELINRAASPRPPRIPALRLYCLQRSKSRNSNKRT